jgi:cytochrome c-type biogenesis protein CcmH
VFRAISICRILALMSFLFSGLSAAIDDQQLINPDQRSDYEKLIREMRCPESANQSLADSSEPRAAGRRREISDLLTMGMQPADIKIFLAERYGDQILYRPRLQTRTIMLWFALPMLMIAGLFMLWRVISYRARLPVSTTTGAAIKNDNLQRL